MSLCQFNFHFHIVCLSRALQVKINSQTVSPPAFIASFDRLLIIDSLPRRNELSKNDMYLLLNDDIHKSTTRLYTNQGSPLNGVTYQADIS